MALDVARSPRGWVMNQFDGIYLKPHPSISLWMYGMGKSVCAIYPADFSCHPPTTTHRRILQWIPVCPSLWLCQNNKHMWLWSLRRLRFSHQGHCWNILLVFNLLIGQYNWLWRYKSLILLLFSSGPTKLTQVQYNYRSVCRWDYGLSLNHMVPMRRLQLMMIWVSDLMPVLLSILIFICLGSSSFICGQTMTDLFTLPKGSKIESPLGPRKAQHNPIDGILRRCGGHGLITPNGSQ